MLIWGKKPQDLTDDELQNGIDLFRQRFMQSITELRSMHTSNDWLFDVGLITEQRRREDVAFGLNEAVRDVLTATLN